MKKILGISDKTLLSLKNHTTMFREGRTGDAKASQPAALFSGTLSPQSKPSRTGSALRQHRGDLRARGAK